MRPAAEIAAELRAAIELTVHSLFQCTCAKCVNDRKIQALLGELDAALERDKPALELGALTLEREAHNLDAMDAWPEAVDDTEEGPGPLA